MRKSQEFFINARVEEGKRENVKRKEKAREHPETKENSLGLIYGGNLKAFWNTLLKKQSIYAYAVPKPEKRNAGVDCVDRSGTTLVEGLRIGEE